jgi:hypothetical protein
MIRGLLFHPKTKPRAAASPTGRLYIRDSQWTQEANVG